MTLYRKVFTKDRLPQYTGEYIWTDRQEQIYSNKGYFYDEWGLNEVEWWLEEFELIDDSEEHGVSIGYNSYDKSIGVFTEGANYILNKLKG